MGGADSFLARTDELQELVGHGVVVGTVGAGRDLANYAIPQHRAHWDNYFNPGLMRHTGPKDMNQPLSHYLSRPLEAKEDELWQTVADHILDEGGEAAMQAAVDDLAAAVVEVTPERSGALKRSEFTDVGGYSLEG